MHVIAVHAITKEFVYMMTWTQQNTPANAHHGLLVLTAKVGQSIQTTYVHGRYFYFIALWSFVKIYCTHNNFYTSIKYMFRFL